MKAKSSRLFFKCSRTKLTPLGETVDAMEQDEDLEKRLQQYISAFNLFDMDADGLITTMELGTIVRSLAYNPTEADLEEMTKQHADEEGKINYDSFLKVMETMRNKPEMSVDEIKEAFRLFDMDDGGTIDSAELRYVMTNYGEKLTNEEVDEMLREADTDGDGEVDYEEFVKMLVSYKH